jgi:hypothetical protein
VISNSVIFEYKLPPREEQVAAPEPKIERSNDNLLKFTLLQRLEAMDDRLQIKQEPTDGSDCVRLRLNSHFSQKHPKTNSQTSNTTLFSKFVSKNKLIFVHHITRVMQTSVLDKKEKKNVSAQVDIPKFVEMASENLSCEIINQLGSIR